MYCVGCGVVLHDTNQAGLLCRPCKQARAESKRERNQAIPIHYCFACGHAYRPVDTSIRHRSCMAAMERAEATGSAPGRTQ